VLLRVSCSECPVQRVVRTSLTVTGRDILPRLALLKLSEIAEAVARPLKDPRRLALMLPQRDPQ
jgi:hypothetical protein